MRDQGLSRTAAHLRVVLGLLLVLLTVAAATPVDPAVQRAADALRTDYVYRDPGAESHLTDAEVGLLTKDIAGAGTPVWVALLPESVLSSYGGSAHAVAQAVADAGGQQGVYAVVVGPSAFAAVSTVAEHPVDDLVRDAQKSGPVVFDVVSAFVDRMRTTYGSGAGGPGRATGGGTAIAVLVLIVAGGGAFWLTARRRRLREERRAELAAGARPGRAARPVGSDVARGWTPFTTRWGRKSLCTNDCGHPLGATSGTVVATAGQ